MAHPPRTANSGTFFLTAITHNRRLLFQTDANATLFIQTLQHYRTEGLYKLHAFVVMPDHHDPRKGPASAGPKTPGQMPVPLCRRPEWSRRHNDQSALLRTAHNPR